MGYHHVHIVHSFISRFHLLSISAAAFCPWPNSVTLTCPKQNRGADQRLTEAENTYCTCGCNFPLPAGKFEGFPETVHTVHAVHAQFMLAWIERKYQDGINKMCKNTFINLVATRWNSAVRLHRSDLIKTILNYADFCSIVIGGNQYVSVAYKLQAVTQVVLHVSLFYASSWLREAKSIR